MAKEKKENFTHLPKSETKVISGQIPRPPVVVVVGHIDHGKCVAPNTSVLLANGEILNIEQIWKKYVIPSDIRRIKKKGKRGWVAKPKNLKVFSFDGSKITTQPVQYIWKLGAPSQLIKIELNPGDEIIVTPEHPFFVYTPKGEIEKKRADSLKKGEFVVVPQKIKFFTPSTAIKKRIIQRLGNLKNFVIFLHKERGKELLQKLQSVNKQELFRKGLFSVSPFTVFQKGRFWARDFVKIGRHFGFSFQTLYEMVDFIKYADERQRVSHRGSKINLPLIPQHLQKLGYILGCLAGDGQTMHGIFHNSNPGVQESFQEAMEEVFGVSTKLIKTRTGYKVVNSGWKTLTRFLVDIADFPRYKKSEEIKFPQLFSNFSFIRGFVAGWFDTDGYVSPINNSIEFTSKSRDLVKAISILLLYFGVHSTVYKQKKRGPGFKKKRTYYYLRIANDPYLKRFLNYFSTKHKEKKERIRTAITKSSVSRIFDLTPLSGQNLYSFYINENLLPYFSQRRKYKNLSRYFLRKLLRWKDRVSLPKVFSKSAMKNLINPGEISCVKIRKIKYLKNKYKFVYDLTVPRLHNFIAERVFVHNTAILDCIRKTRVAEKEAGGITQHIGAYEVEYKGKKITFIDTPGHEAFSAMRSRGAKVADIAILVIAGEEGVKPQTKEAISHIKKAGIPMIVAINKIDKPEADPKRVKRELAQADVLVESLGGKVPAVETSAKTGKGIVDLLELILLVAEMEELKADPKKKGEGVVIEAYLDSKRGPTATLLVRDGILNIGEIVGTPSTFGKIKILENFQGTQITKALPSMPVIVLGFEKVPQVGEKFKVFLDFESAQNYVRKKERKREEGGVFFVEEGIKVLNLILKADVVGSLEALEKVLESLPQEKIVLRILKKEVGEISESDLKLAQSAKAKVIGFRVKINPIAKKVARLQNIKILVFDVIYDLIQAVREMMEKALRPKKVRIDLGKIKTLVIFKTEKNRQIIGGRVLEGKVKKGVSIEVFRNEELRGRGKLINLQKERKDIPEAGKREEVGILYEGDVKIEVGDTLVIYTEEKIKEKL